MRVRKIPDWFPKVGDVVGLVFGRKSKPEQRFKVVAVAMGKDEDDVRAKFEGGGQLHFVINRKYWGHPWGRLYFNELSPEGRDIMDDDAEHTVMPYSVVKLIKYREVAKELWPRSKKMKKAAT